MPATRDRHLRNTYGITLAQYECMLESQGDVCAICGEPESQVAVDVATHS
jgi:hypothetical protein